MQSIPAVFSIVDGKVADFLSVQDRVIYGDDMAEPETNADAPLGDSGTAAAGSTVS